MTAEDRLLLLAQRSVKLSIREEVFRLAANIERDDIPQASRSAQFILSALLYLRQSKVAG